MTRKTKVIFVAGGVMSSVGKGIASASIAKVLQARGFAVTAMKIDPYVNIDAGTMNPTEHGEVFVLKDGMECDQDMGNYERFLDLDLSQINYMTTGSVYLSVIEKERNLEYNGRCVHVVPDIPLEVLKRIDEACRVNKAEIVIVEVGGTVGDYQNVLFLEAVRMRKFRYPHDTLLVLVSYLPVLGNGGNELKTKPTQHAVRNLNAVGLHPDFILARAPVTLDWKRKEKLEFMLGLSEGSVISAPDVSNIYDIPLNFEKDRLGEKILRELRLRQRAPDLKAWSRLADKVESRTKEVKIGIVGKYFGSGEFILADSYISVIEAVKHACYAEGRKPSLLWINATDFDEATNLHADHELSKLDEFDGIIVPGGFGGRGVEGKIAVIGYARERGIPFLGLCYGMQLMVVEFARSVLGYRDAHTTEVAPKTRHPVIDILPEQREKIRMRDYGGTMRLGSYKAKLQKGTLAHAAYKMDEISERHRHRFEVNPKYVPELLEEGLVFSGTSPDGRLMEIAELPKGRHRYFIGSQFHPEFTSRPLRPHPLFLGLVRAASEKKES